MYKETQEDYLRSILFDEREDGNEDNNYFSSINTQSPQISYSHAEQAEELSYDLTNMTLDLQGSLQAQPSYQYPQVFPQQQLTYLQQQPSQDQYFDNQLAERKNVSINGFSSSSAESSTQQIQPHFQSNFQEQQQQQQQQDYGINNQVSNGNSVSQKNKINYEETQQFRQGRDLALPNGQSYFGQQNNQNAYFSERSDGRSNQSEEFYHPATQQFQPLHVQKLNHPAGNLVEQKYDQFQIQPQDFKQEEQEEQEGEGETFNKNPSEVGYVPCFEHEQQQSYEYPNNFQYPQQNEQNQQQNGQFFSQLQNSDQQNFKRQQQQQQYEQQAQNYYTQPQNMISSSTYQPQYSIMHSDFSHAQQPQSYQQTCNVYDSNIPSSEFSQRQFQRTFSPPNRIQEQNNFPTSAILPMQFQHAQIYGNTINSNADTTSMNNRNQFQATMQPQTQHQVAQLNTYSLADPQLSGQIQGMNLLNNNNGKLNDSNLPIKKEEEDDEEIEGSYDNQTQAVVQQQNKQQQLQQIYQKPQDIKLKPILIPLHKNFQLLQQKQSINPQTQGIQQSNNQPVNSTYPLNNNLPKGIHKINHKTTSDQNSKQLSVKQLQDRKLAGKFHKKTRFIESETEKVTQNTESLENNKEKTQNNTLQQGNIRSYDEEDNNSSWVHCNGEIQRRRSQSQENLEEVQDKTSRAEDEEEKNSKAEEIAILAESIKHCNKKNVVKNIMSAFLTFMNDKHHKLYTEQEQRYIPSLYNSSPNAAAVDQEFRIDEIRKKFKRYIAQKCLNHYTVRLLILHPNYGPIFKHYLLGPIKKWINNSKVADLAAHTKMIGFFIACYQDTSVLEELKRHEKKRAHFS